MHEGRAAQWDARAPHQGRGLDRSVRRIVLHLPATFPWLTTWRRLALAVGALPA